MKDLPVHDRPREKIVNRRATSLKDTELVEAIIGRGTRARDVRVISAVV